MAYFLQVDGDKIVGESTGAMPTGPLPQTRVAVSEQIWQEYVAMRKVMTRDGRKDFPRWDGGAVVEPTDDRVWLRVSVDKPVNAQVGVPVFIADNQDALTITFEKMRTSTEVDSTFTKTQIIETNHGEVWQLDFVDGVATKTIQTDRSGRMDILQSQGRFRLSAPIRVLAVEV